MLKLQEYLFQRIREKLPASASLADTVAEKLFISNDSAYRRIRGETPLVLEEAKLLCEAFGISLDTALSARSNTVIFSRVLVQNDSFEKYLGSILDAMKLLQSAPRPGIIYLSKDLPIFYDFAYRPIFAFHYFFWMKSILRHPEFTQRQYDPALLPPEVEALGREIVRCYCSIPSTEIWNSECVNSTIAQIEYYREAGYFNNESDPVEIYRALEATLDHIHDQAETGSKFFPGEPGTMRKDNFQFFHNRLVMGSNTIMVEQDGRKTVYLNYDVLDYMATIDAAFCNETSEKLQNLMKRATLLSHANDKQRSIFFNHLKRKIPQRTLQTIKPE
ncbi:MAG TPA: hypothetical protein VFZ78_08280 [Flavisolibacter sp.]